MISFNEQLAGKKKNAKAIKTIADKISIADNDDDEIELSLQKKKKHKRQNINNKEKTAEKHPIIKQLREEKTNYTRIVR